MRFAAKKGDVRVLVIRQGGKRVSRVSHEPGLVRSPCRRHGSVAEQEAPLIRLALIEDDPQVVARVREAVVNEPDLNVAAVGRNYSEGSALVERGGFDVLLCDLGLPDGNGVDLIRRAAAKWPDADVVVVTVFADQANVLNSIRAGASGYVLKDEHIGALPQRVRELRAGGSPISPIIARQLLRRLQPSAAPDAISLSEREAHVLDLLARGFAYAEIARLLNVSAETIGTYIKRLYRKLQVHSRSEAVYEAQKRGLLDPD